MGMTDKEKLVELLQDVESNGFFRYGTDCRTGEVGGHEMTAEDIADYLLENGCTFCTPVAPGCDDQYNIAEMSYNNGYAKGLEDGMKETEKRAKWVTKTAHGVSWTECPVCMVCGSPQWKCCPVCETKMEVSNGD